MMKIFLQFILICVLSVAIVLPVFAQQNTGFSLLDSGLERDIDWQSDNAANSYNPATNKTTMAQIISDVIKVFLGLLGIIFVIIVIVAGYNWMTASGNEEKVFKAQKLLSRGVIGLIIIVAAYALTYWIFARLPY